MKGKLDELSKDDRSKPANRKKSCAKSVSSVTSKVENKR